jgi:hypothetical protein
MMMMLRVYHTMILSHAQHVVLVFPSLLFYFNTNTGTTIGYGDITPSSDLGRFSLALYALLIVNVMGGFLDVVRQQLEVFCQITPDVDSDKRKTTAAATAAAAEPKTKVSNTKVSKKSD